MAILYRDRIPFALIRTHKIRNVQISTRILWPSAYRPGAHRIPALLLFSRCRGIPRTAILTFKVSLSNSWSHLMLFCPAEPTRLCRTPSSTRSIFICLRKRNDVPVGRRNAWCCRFITLAKGALICYKWRSTANEGYFQSRCLGNRCDYGIFKRECGISHVRTVTDVLALFLEEGKKLIIET